MPKILNISREEHDYLYFPNIKWYPEATNHKGLVKGGIYLFSGPPGCGKTTVALEMMVDLAWDNNKVLYITLEQSPNWLKDTVENRIFPHRKKLLLKSPKNTSGTYWQKELDNIGKYLEMKNEISTDENNTMNNLFIDSSVSNMDMLNDFLVRQVLRHTSEYYNVNTIVVDSIQGGGLSSTSTRPYSRLFEFCRNAKEHKITIILIGHVTKSGQIAGPKTLEHNVDCVLYMRKAMKLRPLFVPKNRFGPERHEPFSLITNKYGCLEKSKHISSTASMAYGFLPSHNPIIEVQALVKLPRFGSKAGLLAPYLPKQKLQQVIGIVSSLPDVDISDMSFEVNCYIPSPGRYAPTLDFALAVSMLSSYFQLPIPFGSLFVGELDLTKQIRPIDPKELELLITALSECFLGHIRKVFISETQSLILKQMLTSNHNDTIEVIGVNDLQAFIEKIWEEMMVS